MPASFRGAQDLHFLTGDSREKKSTWPVLLHACTTTRKKKKTKKNTNRARGKLRSRSLSFFRSFISGAVRDSTETASIVPSAALWRDVGVGRSGESVVYGRRSGRRRDATAVGACLGLRRQTTSRRRQVIVRIQVGPRAGGARHYRPYALTWILANRGIANPPRDIIISYDTRWAVSPTSSARRLFY